MKFVYISPEFPKSNWQFCDRLKRNGLTVLGIGQERRAPAAGVIAGTGLFDLDHVGAEIGQHLGGPGAGQDA